MYVLASVWVLHTTNAKHNTWPGFWCKLKKPIFCWILHQVYSFFAFFQLFNTKTAENDYFDQRLGCIAPKCWWKYTTHTSFFNCGHPQGMSSFGLLESLLDLNTVVPFCILIFEKVEILKDETYVYAKRTQAMITLQEMAVFNSLYGFCVV